MPGGAPLHGVEPCSQSHQVAVGHELAQRLQRLPACLLFETFHEPGLHVDVGAELLQGGRGDVSGAKGQLQRRQRRAALAREAEPEHEWDHHIRRDPAGALWVHLPHQGRPILRHPRRLALHSALAASAATAAQCAASAAAPGAFALRLALQRLPHRGLQQRAVVRLRPPRVGGRDPWPAAWLIPPQLCEPGCQHGLVRVQVRRPLLQVAVPLLDGDQ
mmetsp:Transcript_96863/g.278168  ORF Transcript_96863/g.278168 Transcript_96863/m.278168 type:complete len:218 (-) Transcript_96863:32-685(-)